HGILHARGAAQQGDPIIIDNASPTLSDTLVDQANMNVDNIQVNGTMSAATFDHMEVTACHCAFHFNGGSGNTISNSYVHGNLYGLMVESSKNNQILHNNFEMNSVVNIGVCAGGTATVTQNYFDTTPIQGCTFMATQPAAGKYTTDVGPRP